MLIKDFDFLIACKLGYFENTEESFHFVFTKKVETKIYKRQILGLAPAEPKPKPHVFF